MAFGTLGIPLMSLCLWDQTVPCKHSSLELPKTWSRLKTRRGSCDWTIVCVPPIGTLPIGVLPIDALPIDALPIDALPV